MGRTSKRPPKTTPPSGVPEAQLATHFEHLLQHATLASEAVIAKRYSDAEVSLNEVRVQAQRAAVICRKLSKAAAHPRP